MMIIEIIMSCRRISAILLSLFCVSGLVSGEIFSSMDQLIRLTPSINQVPKYLDSFLRLQEEKLLQARKLVRTWPFSSSIIFLSF